jgi:hypothetical protein
MKIVKIIGLVFIVTITTDGFALNAEKPESTTHLYNDIAIQSIDSPPSNKSYGNEIIISKAQFTSTLIKNSYNKIPDIGKPIWSITLKDFHVPEEACLAIDATLCANYPATDKPKQCFDTCNLTGPQLVAYDEKNHLLYLDTATDISGTGGIPKFLFVADVNTKQIKYLNTFVGPYSGFLSPNGKYLALAAGWNEINICDTHTGNSFDIHEENTLLAGHEQRHGLKIIAWLNDKELKYEDINPLDKNQSIADATVEKVFNVETKQIAF